jgi:hypothetical protein
MKKIHLTILSILIGLPLILSAQNNPSAVLEYFEDPYGDMIITNDTGTKLSSFDMGEVLPPGFSISTGGGIAEIRLNPNGTILKLAEDTDFSITNLQGYKGSPSNEFTLLSGKMRTIAARASGLDYYNVRTPTAVMGVRGTDFINQITSSLSSLVVREGLVEVIPFEGPSVMVAQNQALNTLSEFFQPVTLPDDEVEALFQSMAFKVLSPLDVPGHEPLTLKDAAEESPEEETAAEKLFEMETPVLDNREKAEAPKEKSAPLENSELARVLRSIFGMEIGTTTIDGNTYSKIIIEPTIDIGRFRLGLYLPAIYVDNMFDMDEWYKPQGNDEWSFGSDQGDDFQEVLLDILKDTMLKIKYMEYGDQGWDPFYLKVGNLNNMSIGHGGIMNNYANDSEFPAIRKVGLNTGLDLGKFGLEFVGDNLADLSITGGRLFSKPFSFYEQFQIGATGIADLFPARIASNPDTFGDPLLLAFGMDMEFFKINKDNFKLMLFGDISTMMPLFRSEPTLSTTSIASGAATEIFYEDGSLRNYGIIAGLRGNFFSFNWALEYRMSNGIYKPSLFNALYDRNKIEYLSEIIDYLDDPSDRGTIMGIYGEGGFAIKRKLAFTMGYYWPWEINDGTISLSSDDHFKTSIIFMEGLIPRIPLHGSISYERTELIDTLKGDSDLTMFDGNTVVSGEVIYPIARTLDIVLGVSTVVLTDDDGNLQMESDGVTPKIAPVINIETRIHF